MNETTLRAIGLAGSLALASAIAWVYARQPGSVGEITAGVASSLGAYRVDRESFDEGLRFFRREQFDEARSAWERADPARLDGTTQFYVAYSCYRQGWGRVVRDQALYRQGLEAIERAIAVSPGRRVAVTDAGLRMTTSDELRAELARGLRFEAADLDPRRMLEERK